jgi:hypothetical protein
LLRSGGPRPDQHRRGHDRHDDVFQPDPRHLTIPCFVNFIWRDCFMSKKSAQHPMQYAILPWADDAGPRNEQ